MGLPAGLGTGQQLADGVHHAGQDGAGQRDQADGLADAAALRLGLDLLDLLLHQVGGLVQGGDQPGEEVVLHPVAGQVDGRRDALEGLVHDGTDLLHRAVDGRGDPVQRLVECRVDAVQGLGGDLRPALPGLRQLRLHPLVGLGGAASGLLERRFDAFVGVLEAGFEPLIGVRGELGAALAGGLEVGLHPVVGVGGELDAALAGALHVFPCLFDQGGELLHRLVEGCLAGVCG